MNLTFCNTTAEYEEIIEEPLWHDFTFHHFGLILSAVFGLIAVVLSMWLMFQHATHYLKPWEQRHIIRILFMVPIYAVVSFLSYKYYRHTIYFEVIRDCYEAFAIASFFALLCHYIAPDLHSQKDYFRQLAPKPWLWPASWMQKCCGGPRGWARTPRSGLTWFNIIWFFVFQYCFIRVFMTIVAVVTQAAGRYCLDSLSPAFAHVWTAAIEAICVTFAMYCLIQFYYQIKDDISEHKPLLKVLAIKLVIFLSFWQTIIINFLTSSGAIRESPRIAIPDVKIGIPSMLLSIEMAIFAILHIWAYPWQPYDIKRSPIFAAETGAGYVGDAATEYKGGFLGWKAVMDAFNPWDLIKAVGRGFRWVAVGRRTRETDISYKGHLQGNALDNMGDATGKKAGKYQQLNSDDEGQATPPRYTHQGQGTYTSGGNMDQRTMMPGRLGEGHHHHQAPPPQQQQQQQYPQHYPPQRRDNFGSSPYGDVEPVRTNQDTTYYGVADGGDDRRQDQWRQPGR